MENAQQQADRDWLVTLDKEIWEEHRGSARPNMRGSAHEYTYRVVKRKLTREEYDRFVKVAPQYIVEPRSMRWHFSFGLVLHEAPDYPGLPTKPIFILEGGHLPQGMPDNFNGGWEALSPLSHNPRNVEMLTLYKFAPIAGKSQYDY